MHSLKTLALALLILTAGGLAGCSSTGSGDLCCVPGAPTSSTQAACRCGPTCLWPPERSTLEAGEVQLTPSLNKAFCCPSFGDNYQYTRAPVACAETEERGVISRRR